MKEYECDDCGKKFNKKSNYDNHKNRKNPCKNLIIPNKSVASENNGKEELSEKNILNNDSSDNKNLLFRSKINTYDNIDAKTMKKYLDECKCVYCGNQYTRKNNVIYHIKHNCKKVKEIENEKLQIFNKLKRIEEENQKLKILDERKFKSLEEENIKIKQETAQLKKVVNKLEKELKKSTQNITNIGSINKNSNNVITTNNNQQNIVLVGYKKEDMENIDPNEFLEILKRGYQAPVELTRIVHFNPKYPEFHNIYIPKINEKYGMVYVDGKWRLMDKNDLVEDIYENKRDYIIQNLDKFMNQLNEHKKKSLNRWLNTDDDDISIKNTKNDIKMLLFDNRHMAMNQKRIMNKEQRKLEVINLPKKVKPNPTVKVEEVDENDENDINKKNNYITDSSESENYSYLYSDSSESSNSDSEGKIE